MAPSWSAASGFFSLAQILWTFTIYLESVAILPQLFMISKTGEAETITTHYLFFLGLYRALYLANWIRRYQTENFYDQIAVVSGVVQTIFYCDFFYLYVTKGRCWENSVTGTSSGLTIHSVFEGIWKWTQESLCASWCLHSNAKDKCFQETKRYEKV